MERKDYPQITQILTDYKGRINRMISTMDGICGTDWIKRNKSCLNQLEMNETDTLDENVCTEIPVIH